MPAFVRWLSETMLAVRNNSILHIHVHKCLAVLAHHRKAHGQNQNGNYGDCLWYLSEAARLVMLTNSSHFLGTTIWFSNDYLTEFFLQLLTSWLIPLLPFMTFTHTHHRAESSMKRWYLFLRGFFYFFFFSDEKLSSRREASSLFDASYFWGVTIYFKTLPKSKWWAGPSLVGQRIPTSAHLSLEIIHCWWYHTDAFDMKQEKITISHCSDYY